MLFRSYDFLRAKKITELNELGRGGLSGNASQISSPNRTSLPDSAKEDISKALSYAEHKEQQKRIKRAEKAVKESETKIEKMETRLKELDNLLMEPENASDMVLVTEYTQTKQALDEEVERWEKLSEELESITNS